MTARGFAQADSLVSTLAGMGIDHIRCSPYDRAWQSVAPFASASGLGVRLDERLVERRRSRQPIGNYIAFVRQSFADFDFCKPGGESGREVGTRGFVVLREMFDSPHRQPLLSSHGQLLSFLTALVDPGYDFEHWQQLTLPALFRFRREHDAISYEVLPLASVAPTLG